jgi:hypothetical protein
MIVTRRRPRGFRTDELRPILEAEEDTTMSDIDNSEHTALAVAEPPTQLVPAEQIARAGDVARACHQIVLRTALDIKGRRFIRAEGWQSIATAHGCCASSRDVRRVEGGIVATGIVRRIDTGEIVAEAEGFVGDDEPRWSDQPEYARRGMAQTRAISRACRSAFSHVVVLMDDPALQTMPAEEVDEHEPAQSRGRRRVASNANRTLDGNAPIGEAGERRLLARLRELNVDYEQVLDRLRTVDERSYERITGRDLDEIPLAIARQIGELLNQWEADAPADADDLPF